MSMQPLSSSADFQLRIYNVDSAEDAGIRSLVAGGGESASTAAANYARAPWDEEVHQAQPHPEAQILEIGFHLSLVIQSWMLPSH